MYDPETSEKTIGKNKDLISSFTKIPSFETSKEFGFRYILSSQKLSTLAGKSDKSSLMIKSLDSICSGKF